MIFCLKTCFQKIEISILKEFVVLSFVMSLTAVDTLLNVFDKQKMAKLGEEKKSDDLTLDATVKSGFDLRYAYRVKTSKSQIQHNTTLDIYHEANALRSSGIVCTIGPASQSVDMLVKLIQNGMDVVRMNCSHGTHDYHKTTQKNATLAAQKCGENIAIALDTKGPEIRTGMDIIYIINIYIYSTYIIYIR